MAPPGGANARIGCCGSTAVNTSWYRDCILRRVQLPLQAVTQDTFLMAVDQHRQQDLFGSQQVEH